MRALLWVELGSYKLSWLAASGLGLVICMNPSAQQDARTTLTNDASSNIFVCLTLSVQACDALSSEQIVRIVTFRCHQSSFDEATLANKLSTIRLSIGRVLGLLVGLGNYISTTPTASESAKGHSHQPVRKLHDKHTRNTDFSSRRNPSYRSR